MCTFMRCGHLTYNPWVWLKVTSMASTASNRKSDKNPLNSGFFMIHSTLRHQDWSFCCQVIGNIIFIKFFDEMRLLRPLRSLRLLRSLRPLRFLMAGKSPTNQSVSSFWFFEAKEAVEVIEASDVTMSVEVIKATEVFKTT